MPPTIPRPHHAQHCFICAPKRKVSLDKLSVQLCIASKINRNPQNSLAGRADRDPRRGAGQLPRARHHLDGWGVDGRELPSSSQPYWQSRPPKFDESEGMLHPCYVPIEHSSALTVAITAPRWTPVHPLYARFAKSAEAAPLSSSETAVRPGPRCAARRTPSPPSGCSLPRTTPRGDGMPTCRLL